MARYQGFVQGNRGEATRLGTAKSGMWATARGWEGGAHIALYEKDGRDYINISVGPHGNTGQTTILEGPVADIVKNAGLVWLQLKEKQLAT